MKLFLIWLLGVPLLVASIVSVPAVARFVMPASNYDQHCLLEDQPYDVALTVTDQGHRVLCHARSVK
jgi:hypothetical protein